MNLLHPFDLKGLPLKNRVVLAPMTRARAGRERLANALMAEYYAQRAGAGLLITEATTVSAQGNGWVNSPGIYTDVNEFEIAPGWAFTAVVIVKPGVTLLGRPDAPETVVIRGGDSTLGVVCLDADSTTTLAGFTVTGARHGLMGRHAAPTIEHCRFEENGAYLGIIDAPADE